MLWYPFELVRSRIIILRTVEPQFVVFMPISSPYILKSLLLMTSGNVQCTPFAVQSDPTQRCTNGARVARDVIKQCIVEFYDGLSIKLLTRRPWRAPKSSIHAGDPMHWIVGSRDWWSINRAEVSYSDPRRWSDALIRTHAVGSGAGQPADLLWSMPKQVIRAIITLVCTTWSLLGVPSHCCCSMKHVG